MLVQTRGEGGGDATSVDCPFSITPLPRYTAPRPMRSTSSKHSCISRDTLSGLSRVVLLPLATLGDAAIPLLLPASPPLLLPALPPLLLLSPLLRLLLARNTSNPARAIWFMPSFPGVVQQVGTARDVKDGLDVVDAARWRPRAVAARRAGSACMASSRGDAPRGGCVCGRSLARRDGWSAAMSLWERGVFLTRHRHHRNHFRSVGRWSEQQISRVIFLDHGGDGARVEVHVGMADYYPPRGDEPPSWCVGFIFF